MKFKNSHPEAYAKTAHISLVSSWLASVLLGKVARMDMADACGMNLWDMRTQQWNQELLALAAGGSEAEGAELHRKLGDPCMDGGASYGAISPYFVSRYGFSQSCQVVPFTGDNPGTILALPLRPLDAIVSLGTSTTFLMNTPKYRPDGSYHFFNHPTTPGHYMFMLCYKNGGLAREKIRNQLLPVAATPPSATSGSSSDAWDRFNRAILDEKPLGMDRHESRAKLGLYFPLRETVPNIRPGYFRFTCKSDGSDLQPAEEGEAWGKELDPRIIVESQALSMRLRSQNLVHSPTTVNKLPAQPRRIYLVGGGSLNPAIARVIGEVLGGTDGVYKLDVGGNACALGGAYKALWATERRDGESFDDLLAERWKEEGAIEKVDQGYRAGVYQQYGDVLGAFSSMEERLLAEEEQHD